MPLAGRQQFGRSLAPARSCLWRLAKGRTGQYPLLPVVLAPHSLPSLGQPGGQVWGASGIGSPRAPGPRRGESPVPWGGGGRYRRDVGGPEARKAWEAGCARPSKEDSAAAPARRSWGTSTWWPGATRGGAAGHCGSAAEPPPGRVPAPPVWHGPDGPCRPHGRRPRGLGRPRGLPVPRLPATPSHGMGRLCRPPPGRCRPQPTAPPAWGPAGQLPQDFVEDLVRWTGTGVDAGVCWAELSLDYKAFVGRALPASPDHRLRGMRLPLGERAQDLRKAAGLVEHHLVAGTLLCGAPLGGAAPFSPLGAACSSRLTTRWCCSLCA